MDKIEKILRNKLNEFGIQVKKIKNPTGSNNMFVDCINDRDIDYLTESVLRKMIYFEVKKVYIKKIGIVYPMEDNGFIFKRRQINISFDYK